VEQSQSQSPASNDAHTKRAALAHRLRTNHPTVGRNQNCTPFFSASDLGLLNQRTFRPSLRILSTIRSHLQDGYVNEQRDEASSRRCPYCVRVDEILKYESNLRIMAIFLSRSRRGVQVHVPTPAAASLPSLRRERGTVSDWRRNDCASRLVERDEANMSIPGPKADLDSLLFSALQVSISAPTTSGLRTARPPRATMCTSSSW